jgi:DNA invertase Pin-like site-specific DNA recombinase
MTFDKRAVIYTRGGIGSKTTEYQLLKLREYAERAGYAIVAELPDNGNSGGEGRGERPGYKRLCIMLAQKQVDIVLAWSVDRISCSLPDLLQFLRRLRAKQVDLFLHEQALDTTLPSGKAVFQLLDVFADLEKSLLRERILAGLERARANGKTLGRPSVASKPSVIAEVRALRASGAGATAIARKLRIGVGTTTRILSA